MGRADACTLYVVRVWSAGDGFHAEVRDVHCERGVDFTDAGALASFFAAAPLVLDADSSPPEVHRNREEPR